LTTRTAPRYGTAPPTAFAAEPQEAEKAGAAADIRPGPATPASRDARLGGRASRR